MKLHYLPLLQLVVALYYVAAQKSHSKDGYSKVVRREKMIEHQLSPGVTALLDDIPAWAKAPAPLNYTVAFHNLVSPEGPYCAMQLDLFSSECGMCKKDCPILVHKAKMANRYTTDKEAADLIVVSPEMGRIPNYLKDRASPYSENNLTRAVFELPLRPPGKYYVIRKHRAAVNYKCEKRLLPGGTVVGDLAVPGAGVKCKAFCDVLFRRDIIWANYDLAEHHILDDTLPGLIRGVTLPAGSFWYKSKVHPLEQRFGTARNDSIIAWKEALKKADNRRAEAPVHSKDLHNPPLPILMPQEKYLAWFRGKCHDGAEDSSHVRFELSLAFQAQPRDDVLLEVYKDWHSYECPGVAAPSNRFVRTETAARKESARWFTEDYYKVAMRSTFGFVPHGDARWSLRFLELLSAGLIPVNIADGLRLPFDQVIDWPSIVITIPEADLKRTDAAKVLEPMLTMDENETRRRSVLAYAVFRNFFSSAEIKVDAFYAAVGSIIYHDTVQASQQAPQFTGGVCVMSGKPPLPAQPNKRISERILANHLKRWPESHGS